MSYLIATPQKPMRKSEELQYVFMPPADYINYACDPLVKK